MIYIHVEMSFGDNGAAVHWVAVKKHRRTHVVNSYIYIQGCFAGDRVRPVVKANACKKRKTTAKGRLRCQGLLANIPINPGRLENLILTTDCVFIISSSRDLNHDYGNAWEPFPDLRHCVSGSSEGSGR